MFTSLHPPPLRDTHRGSTHSTTACEPRSSTAPPTPSWITDTSMRTLLSLDDFDEFRERAFSGGSLYGVLRRQAFLRGPARQPPDPSKRSMIRQRSKSLIQRSVALPEDKSILKMLCEYSECAKRQLMKENRRHSEAALLYNKEYKQRNSYVGLHRAPTPRRRPRPPSPIPLRQSCGGSLDTPSLQPDFTNQTTPPVPNIGGDFAKQNPTNEVSSMFLTIPQIPYPPDMGRLSLSAPGPYGGGPLGGAGRSVCRRRSFSLTQYGIVNDGDEMITLPTTPRPSIVPSDAAFSFDGSCLQLTVVCPPMAQPAQRSRSNSVYTREAGMVPRESICESMGGIEIPVYRVLMLGGPGVGKTALTQQFVTSEYMAAQNTSFDDGIEIPIPVLLDGEESVIEFVDLPYNGELNTWRDYDVDGYIIIYSITDRRSYQKAVDVLYNIRGESPLIESCSGSSSSSGHNNKPIILVANKSDLERSRIISKEEGRTIAETYNSKYIDVSAILNHKVDDLLVGILKQIRLSRDCPRRRRVRQHSRDDTMEVGGCFPRSKHSLFTKFVRKSSRKHSRSCENLLRL